MIHLDDWQREILDYKGDIMLVKGRRIGGTEIFSIKAAKRLVDEPGTKIVFVSLTEDQAKICIDVALNWLTENHRGLIGKGKDKPQLGKITVVFKDRKKSIFQVRPVGQTGNAVRGFDGDILGVDEAPWQPQMMWKAARPIISTNDGEIWMWGTPANDEGYFYEQYTKARDDPEHARFKLWEKNSEEVLFNRPISSSWTEKQRDGAIRILNEEKKDMTEEEYANEYLGQFMSNLRRLFKDDWVEKVCILPPENVKPKSDNTALGCDIADIGGDETTFEGLERPGEIITQFHHETMTRERTTEAERRIIELNRLFDFRGIGIDDMGVGRGVLNTLLEHDETKQVVKGLNNSTIEIDYEKNTKKLKKEAMYYLTKNFGEKGLLQLFNHPDIKRSLKSIQVLENGKIAGRYSHIVEGIIRAVELLKQKDLNLKIYSIKI